MSDRAPLVALAVLALSACTAPGGPPGDPGRDAAALAARIDAIVAEGMTRQPIAGVAVTVLSKSGSVLSRSYGVAEVETGTPATDATSYRIGSVSKLITAVAVMRLVDKRALSLDDSVSSILPQARINPAVTVRHMLNHTSGLPDHEIAAVERWMKERLPITDEYVLQVVAGTPGAAPGETWRYVSSPFHLLGLVIQKAAGSSYTDFIQREIAAPLGLTTVRLCSGAEPARSQAKDYLAVAAGFELDESWQLPGIFSAGGLCASATDVARLVQAVAAGQLLSAGSHREMLNPTLLAGGIRADYGLGITLGSLGGRMKWGHTGGGAHSNRAAAAHYPDAGLTIVVLMNTESDDSRATAIDLEAQIARSALGLAGPASGDVELNFPPDRYTGFYGEGSGRSEIRAERAGLTYKRLASSAEPALMAYQGHDEFIPFADTPEFRFHFQTAGQRAFALAIYEGGWFRGLRKRAP